MGKKSKTLSASVPEQVYRQTHEIVQRERRKQSAVVADALRLYASLTPAARQVMEHLGQRYGPDALGKLTVELSGAVLRSQWEALAEETRHRLPADVAGLSDEDLARAVDEEVAATRKERRRERPRP